MDIHPEEAPSGVEVPSHTLLFGDHMSIVLPPGACDVSELREIPDHQEVFLHRMSDQSLVVEILQRVSQSDDKAIRVHFEDIATANDASGEDNQHIHRVDPIPSDQLSMHQCEAAYYLYGDQRVSKFNETTRNKVDIHMGVFRLPQFDTDILVTLNDSVSVSLQSSSYKEEASVLTQVPDWTPAQFWNTLCSLKLLKEDLLNG